MYILKSVFWSYIKLYVGDEMSPYLKLFTGSWFFQTKILLLFNS